MITIDKRFAEIKFFFSSRFWCGIWKMPRGRRWLVLLWLSASGIIATFVGPTTAVLLKPQLRYDWPAGAANYSIVGNESTIFPRTITSKNDSGGGSLCNLPSTANMEMPPSIHMDCPWAGYSALLTVHNQWVSDLNCDPIIQSPFTNGSNQRKLFSISVPYWTGNISVSHLSSNQGRPTITRAVSSTMGSGSQSH